MKKKYFVLELKKSIEIIKKNLFTFIFTAFILAAAFAAVNFLITQKMVIKPIKVAVIINEDDNMTQMVMRYISKEESIKNISEFIYCKKDSAFEQLNKSDVSAVIDFGDDFFENVNNGTNTPLKVYIRENSDFVTVAFVGMLYSAQGYVQNTEAAVYSFLKVIREDNYAVKDLDMNVGDYLALQYGRLILHRQNIFENNIVSPYGSTNIYDYYYSCILIVMIIYITLTFTVMYDSSEAVFGKVIRIYGLKSLSRSLIKQTVIIIPVTVFTTLILLLKKLLFYRFDLPNIDGWFYYLGWFFTIIGIISLFNMLMSLIGESPISMLFIIFFFSLLIISSGILIPYTFLPLYFEYLGKISPFYYSNNIMFNQKTLISIIVSTILIILENVMVIKCEKH